MSFYNQNNQTSFPFHELMTQSHSNSRSDSVLSPIWQLISTSFKYQWSYLVVIMVLWDGNFWWEIGQKMCHGSTRALHAWPAFTLGPGTFGHVAKLWPVLVCILTLFFFLHLVLIKMDVYQLCCPSQYPWGFVHISHAFYSFYVSTVL